MTMMMSGPLITNYNDSGDAFLIEGKTLLVSLTYPFRSDELTGSLPVLIEPESTGGEQLKEPQPLSFYPGRDGRVVRTIVSAPLDVIEGNQTLSLARSEQPEVTLWKFPYLIRRGNYRSTSLTLDKEFSAPSPEVAARMRQDFDKMLEVLKRRSPRQWTAPFILPVYQGDNDNFGVKRTVNGTKRYRHAGLDFHAEKGTEVHAVNDGIVALSGEQWVAGQTVCIDHGNSVFSKYAHLSRRRVEEGDAVKRGQVIALSGDSGGQKASPHLHLDIIINGTHVDPKDFMLRTAAQLFAIESEEAEHG
jgi:murein DD-endopeptidase MepM/ murein hydrolase activator NlpD